MRSQENFTPFFAAGLGLTIAILAIFQLYIQREPARIQADEAADQAEALAAGHELYIPNCTACHGENGEGGLGPALNSQEILNTTSDEAFFGLIRIGVPGTTMPAWGQSFGGPFTDEQILQLVAFIRSLESSAPQTAPEVAAADPERGLQILTTVCFACHGINGQGTEQAPALNNPERLNKLDDQWYRDTIAQGRPAQGMPTWGTVLSPAQIDDLVALLAVWRSGQTVTSPMSLKDQLSSALLALQSSAPNDALLPLNQALSLADGQQVAEIEMMIDLLQRGYLAEVRFRLSAMVDQTPGDTVTDEGTEPIDTAEEGEALYAANCAACHGEDGTGGIGPNLHANTLIQSMSESDLVDFLLEGVPGTAMPGFQSRLSEGQLGLIAVLLITWQE